MKELIEIINSRFDERTTSLELQKRVWEAVAEYFRPDIRLYGSMRPSVILARETGDLGLAVLWIVQAALARPVLNDITAGIEDSDGIAPVTSCINEKTIVALAHSEAADSPVTYSRGEDEVLLNGRTKFITSGRNADLIMVTCREDGAPKIDSIALVRKSSLPPGSFSPLDLKIMRTVNHAGLALNNLALANVQVPECDPALIRRSIKKWGIIERALIIEAFPAFLLYCNYLFSEMNVTIASDDEIIALLERQSESAARQIEEAFSEKRISTENAPMADLLKITGRFQKAFMEKEGDMPGEERIRLADLFLFNSLKG